VDINSVLWHCWLGGRKGIWPVKNGGMVGGGHWLVRMEWRLAGWSVSASVNLPLHHKVQKFSSGSVSPGWSRKKGHKMVVVSWHEFMWIKNVHFGTDNTAVFLYCEAFHAWFCILLESHCLTYIACSQDIFIYVTRWGMTSDLSPSMCRKSTLRGTVSPSCTTDCHFTEVLPSKTDFS